MKLSSIFTALGLLVATPAYATVTLTYSGTANIDIDGVTQVNANVAWTISFDESGVSDNDVDNNEGDGQETGQAVRIPPPKPGQEYRAEPRGQSGGNEQLAAVKTISDRPAQ